MGGGKFVTHGCLEGCFCGLRGWVEGVHWGGYELKGEDGGRKGQDGACRCLGAKGVVVSLHRLSGVDAVADDWRAKLRG